ncbi:hypothetical protein ACLBOM_22830 [Escherichia coli]
MTNLPKFSTALLHPRYWLHLVGYWRTLVSGAIALPRYVLPTPPVVDSGKLALLSFMKQHAKIVHRNLELCFRK